MLVSIDDILVSSKNEKEHEEHLPVVLQTLRDMLNLVIVNFIRGN